MFQVVKVRIYPNTEQQQALAKIFGCVRWLWNHHLALTQKTYSETGRGLSQFEMNNRLPELKQEFAWLSEYPKFKSKRDKQSAHYPQHVQIGEGQLKVPKLGWMKAKLHRMFHV